MKPGTNAESYQLGKGRNNVQIKMNLSKTMDKSKASSRVSTRGELKKTDR